MLRSVRIRLVIIIGLAIISGVVLARRGITLGLDLRGGTHLALEIRDPEELLSPEEREDAIDRGLRVIRSRVDELGFSEPTIQKSGRDRIIVELPGLDPAQQLRAKEVIERAAFLKFQIVGSPADLELALPRMDRAAAGIMAANDPLPPGVTSDSDAEQPETSSSSPSTPGRQSGARPLSDRLHPADSGTGAIFLVEEEEVSIVQRILTSSEVEQAIPRGLEFRWGASGEMGAEGFQTLYLLEERELITGDHLVDARALRDPQLGYPIVTFQFSRAGGRIFEQGTGQNVGRPMAIVLDEQVMSAPTITEAIRNSGRIEMSGSSLEEASDLALILRAGSLPAPLQIAEERSVGPSLGQDSVDQGQVAGVIGLSLIVLIMLFYYRMAGVLAVGGLALYVLFVLTGLVLAGADLTLPGIAGLILSIGMAVDANVLIFERIREEIAAGQRPRAAVEAGFMNALSAIVDAQVTTLLTAIVLHQLGTGPVRGFAMTLMIGTVASMFTAIFVTRTFFMLYLDLPAGRKEISI